MNVANIELCKELYDLSGWTNPKPGVFEIEKAWRPTPLSSGDNYRLINIGPNTPEDIPAYSLGFLLRKLPSSGSVEFYKRVYDEETKTYTWGVEWGLHQGNTEFVDDAQTPEDAVVLLILELFKQGMFPTEDAS
jgi:hypothetical protein